MKTNIFYQLITVILIICFLIPIDLLSAPYIPEPGEPAPEEKDNTLVIVAATVSVVVIGVVTYWFIKKKSDRKDEEHTTTLNYKLQKLTLQYPEITDDVSDVKLKFTIAFNKLKLQDTKTLNHLTETKQKKYIF